MGRLRRAAVVCFYCAILPVVIPRARAANTGVLPFANATAANTTQASLDWMGESIAEAIRDAVELRGGVASPRDDVEDALRQLNMRPHLLLTQAAILKAGEALDADQIVFGNFQYVPASGASRNILSGRLRITARVYARGRAQPARECSEEGLIDDLPTIEARLAGKIVGIVNPQLASAESEFRSWRATARLDARESYARGMMARETEQQERLFTQAARLDAHFGHPSFAMGRIYYNRATYKQAAEWFRKVERGNVHFSEASFFLGLSLYETNDFAGAQNAFLAVADQVPVNEVFNNLGAAQSRRGIPQAVDSFRKALEGDPADPVYHFNLGYALWQRGDFDAAANSFRASLDRAPDDEVATLMLGFCLKRQGPRVGAGLPTAPQRLKLNYEERAWRQLKALVQPEKQQ